MKSLKAEFKERVESVDKIISHINKISEERGNIDLIVILKSMVYIALYNNIEATMYSIIEEIHDSCQGYEFFKLSKEIKDKIIIYNFGNSSLSMDKKRNLANTFSSPNLFLPQLIEYQKIKTIFSGNLDSYKIREILKSYGVEVKNIRGDSEHLLLVKNKRNKIAHGEQSLSEAGLQVTTKKLINIQKSVSDALSDYIAVVESFLNDKKFLAKAV